jgi:PKD repeat protein
MGVDSVDVTIDTSPSAAFTTSGNPSVYVQFVDQSTGSAPLTYAWDFGDGNTSSSPNPLHQYAAGGAYTVTLTVTNACGSNTAFQIVNATVGISDDLFANSLSVFPNPSQGRFTVAGEGIDAESLTISILDVKGSLVYTHAVGRVVNGFAQEVDIRHLSSGIYLLKVSDGDRTVNKKIILE